MTDPFDHVFGAGRGASRDKEPPASSNADALDELIAWLDSAERRERDGDGPADAAEVVTRAEELGLSARLLQTNAQPPEGLRAYALSGPEGDGMLGIIVKAYVTIAPHSPYYLLHWRVASPAR